LSNMPTSHRERRFENGSCLGLARWSQPRRRRLKDLEDWPNWEGGCRACKQSRLQLPPVFPFSFPSLPSSSLNEGRHEEFRHLNLESIDRMPLPVNSP
jgi:hypothetical protein